MNRRLAALLTAFLVLLATRPAWAETQTLRGIVLSVLPDKHAAVIRHEAYGSMPAMSMMFTLVPADVARLHEGDRIEATVTETPNGEALSHVTVRGPAPTTGTVALRSVTLLRTGDAMPPTRFVDQGGRPFSFAELRGKNVVLAFIYTRCRDSRMCPLISAHMGVLQRHLDPASYHLVEVTLDPQYDRPPILADYARRFGADPAMWTLATGEPDDVLEFAAQFGIVPFADPRVGLIHSERTVLIDRNGRIADLIDEATWSPDNVLARLAQLNHGPINPLALWDYSLSKAVVAICGNGAAGQSGLLDLTIVALIFAAGVWLLIRIGRYLHRAS